MSEAQIIELLTGEGPAGGEDHLAECPQCRSVRQDWVDRLEALRELSRQTIEEEELHQLAVLFRQLGPGRDRAPSLFARLVRSSNTAPAAARGLASGEIMEYNSGQINLIVRVGALGSGRTASVTGQIDTNEEAGDMGGTFSLASPDGDVRFSDVDQFGEFHLSGVDSGSYTGMWSFADRIMVVPEIEIGDDDES